MGRARHGREYKSNRPLVLKRDNNCCVKCGSAVSLEVHHIEGYKNNGMAYLATLCYLCHNIAPMGKDEFAQWLLMGENGIESVERKLSQNGVNKLSRETIWRVLAALVDLGVETNKSRMKAARDRVRQSGLRCEGVKVFGHYPAEKPALERMIALRSIGMTCDKIAAQLSEEGISTRKGAKWLGCTVSRILWREAAELETVLRNKRKQEKA